MDPNATRELPVRCCCPPLDGALRHPDGDIIRIRTQYNYGDALALSRQSVQYRLVEGEKPQVLPYTDAFLGAEAMMRIGVASWTLEDADGKPAEVDPLLLPQDVGEFVSEEINTEWEASRAPLPNGSGAASQGSSSEIGAAPPNRATRRSKKP